MARTTGAQWAEKHARRLKAATEDIRNGVARVTEAPGAAAARAEARMKDNLIKSIDDGTWRTQVSRVPLAAWQEATGRKGVDRIASGVDGALERNKMVGEELMKAVDTAVAEANKTPRGSLEDNINRMNAYVRKMNQLKLRRPAR